MRPVLISVFGLDVPSYFAMLATGLALATWLASRGARRIGQDGEVILDLGLAMTITGTLGARLLHVLADGYFWDYVHVCTDPSLVSWHISQRACLAADVNGIWDAAASVCHPRERNCWAWAAFWAGGLTFYGGLLGATGYAVYFLRRERFPFWKAADLASFGIAMGLAWGRMGCFLAGCCFGRESTLPWAVSFPGGSPASEMQWRTGHLRHEWLPSHPVHPTQLYEAIGCLVLAAVTYGWAFRRKRFDGQALLVFVGGYALLRAWVEMLREDDRGGGFGLSTSQWISLLLFLAVFPAARVLARRGGSSGSSAASTHAV